MAWAFVVFLIHFGLSKIMKHNGFEYVDLSLPSGTKWATCNVGAKNETDFGLYFSWGFELFIKNLIKTNNFYYFFFLFNVIFI